MRGVFNDFASEINRSIGFYSSINRTAKIRKVIGLGNGFKLPGLQKFLQQNLNQEIDRLETFDKLIGDEVKGAPQFQDNLASFGVAYGLGVQGLGRGGLSTNLLPPEIERIRLIRSKKPWALAASALIMLGLTFRFAVGDYRALASVSTLQFQDAVKHANSVTEKRQEDRVRFRQGRGCLEERSSADGEDPRGRHGRSRHVAGVPRRDQPVLPRPPGGLQSQPRGPGLLQDTIDKLEVHIDAIKPVWRENTAEWFEQIGTDFKILMHPIDASTPPSGPGWIVQIACHHYNPYPKTREQIALPSTDPRRTDFGPIQFLTDKVLPKLNAPALRLFGVHHVAVAWLSKEEEWTTEKGQGTNNLASNTIPMLERASPPVTESSGGGGGASGMGGMSQMANMINRRGIMNKDAWARPWAAWPAARACGG